MNIHIETKRLILRKFNETDAIDASNNSRQPIVSHFMSDMVMATEQEAIDWIRWINNDKFNPKIPTVVLAVILKSRNKCIGLIGVAPKHELGNEIEILFSVADEYQNHGYITEAGKALIEWTFCNTPAKYLVAIVKHENTSSNRVIEKLCFAYTGEREIDYDGEMTKFHYYRLYKQHHTILSVREYPGYADYAIDWFASKWSIDRKEYEASVSDCIYKNESLPRWYIMLNENAEIIGGCGLIQNDFVDRVDLFPYLCALFVEKQYRGNALGAKLLQHARMDGAKLGFDKLYLCTDHTSYYEKYGWHYIATGNHPWGSTSRIYEASTIRDT